MEILVQKIMAKKTTHVYDTELVLWDHELDRLIQRYDISDPAEWQYWQAFLESETTKSFRYVGSDGTSCSVIKENRPMFGGEKKPVWIAHKRLDGKLRRKYLGVSENLTTKKLKQAAFQLSQRRLG